MNAGRAQLSASLALSFCVLAITSCRSSYEPVSTETPATDTIVSSTPPFQTKEPERYQATRTISIIRSNGDTVVTRTLIARDGPMRREEPETASGRIVYLELPAGRFVLLPDQKLYAAAAAEDDPATSSEATENSPDRLLHTDHISTIYEVLGTETVGGRTAGKYRIVVNTPGAGNVSRNETFMWIDDVVNMPVKSETRSPDGTRTVMELSNLALDPAKQLFQIPADYEKIGFTALQKQLKGARLNPSVR